jgi:hypothetical protein
VAIDISGLRRLDVTMAYLLRVASKTKNTA